jgi:hypothetical protein
MSRYAPFIVPQLVLVAFLFGLAVLAFSLRGRPPGLRRRHVLLVPLAIGLVLLVLVGVLFGEHLVNAVSRTFSGQLVAGSQYGLPAEFTYVFVAADILVAVIAAYLAVDALPGFVAGLRAARRRGQLWRSRLADGSRVVLVGGLTAAVVAGGVFSVGLLNVTPPSGTSLMTVIARQDLPGAPTGIVLEDDDSGFISFGEGSVAHFVVPPDQQKVTFTTVVDGLVYPRGLAIAEHRLYVVDLGPLPCKNPFPQCWFGEPQQELDVLNASSGRLLAYPIRDDGTLGDPQTILDHLPVVSTEHAPNGLLLSSDGYMYMSVGNVDRMPLAPQLIGRIRQAHREWLGTILRFRPDGSDLSVFARGIRNIFDLATGPDGRLYGADNDGDTVRGLWLEQLFELRRGVDYGYPQHGTFDTSRSPDAAPLTLLPAGGSSAIAWAEDAGLPPGLLVGSLRQLGWVPLAMDKNGPYVNDARNYVSLVQVDGFVTGLATTSKGTLLATVFSGRTGAPSSLILLKRSP